MTLICILSVGKDLNKIPKLQCHSEMNTSIHYQKWDVKGQAKPHMDQFNHDLLLFWVSLTIYLNHCLGKDAAPWNSKDTTKHAHKQSVSRCLSLCLTHLRTHSQRSSESPPEKMRWSSHLKIRFKALAITHNMVYFYSHLFILTNRASVGSEHDKWYFHKLQGPSASWLGANVGTYGNQQNKQKILRLCKIQSVGKTRCVQFPMNNIQESWVKQDLTRNRICECNSSISL